MDYLVLAPPVCTPAEPPSGAFLLTAALAARGYDAALLDLSLELYWDVLQSGGDGRGGPDGNLPWALEYLIDTGGGYDPDRHRTACGILHRALRGFSRAHSGWKLTLMDLTPPGEVHDPANLLSLSESGEAPFQHLWEGVLEPVLSEHRPGKILVSLAYLSQLAATVDLCRFLQRKGQRVSVGGSLINSLSTTGAGMESLANALHGDIVSGDGMPLMPGESDRALDRLAWPYILGNRSYLSSRPIIPLALSTGCYWNRCLFCPDRVIQYAGVPDECIEGFVSTIPAGVLARRPVIHFLDSAMPPASLSRVGRTLGEKDLRFYGFARPESELADPQTASDLAESGCLMLQLGVESGSDRLLDLYDKGLDAERSSNVLAAASGTGIRTYAYFLFGLPGETDRDRDITRDFLHRNAESIDFVNFSIFNLPAACELSERPSDFGIELVAGEFTDASSGAIRLYRPFTSGGVDVRRAARGYLSRMRKTTPRMRELSGRTPRWFRAAHMALMDIPGRKPLGS